MNNEKILTLLDELVQISRDGAAGFRTCALDAQDPSLKLYFQDRAQGCDDAVRTLNTEIRHYGGDPNRSGSAVAMMHRRWIDLQTMLGNRDNLTVLEECERGEALALRAYEEALREEMPDSLRACLNEQYAGVKRNHDRVRELRDEARKNVDLA